MQAVNQVWCPPPDDFLKINTDGAFRLSTKSGGWGFTIKNNHGIALVAGAGSLENVAEPLQAEALAMLYAVNEASRMGCQKVILETDAVALKQAITVRFRVPEKPLRFEHWGAHEDLSSLYLIMPSPSPRYQGLARRTRNTRDTRFILVRATDVV